MNVRIQPLSTLSASATRALVAELGVVDALRFLQQFRVGTGNYTAERATLLAHESVGDIVADIAAKRKS